MCGIAGFIGFKNNSDFAIKANEIQKHRGPDDQSVWEDDYISLSHQRLSIIDLEDRANQPFKKHGLVLVFNGEIYNYLEIKIKLEEDYQSKFTTTSDTEVVLEAFHHLKEKCLDLFVGMFAFCIYDKNTNETFLARDHFGIKPLFYFHDKEKFAFSSELKTLIKLGITSKKINKEALVAALNYLWIPNEVCIFSDIVKLKPGNYCKINKNGVLKETQFWSLNDSEKLNEDPANLLDASLRKTIDSHLIADVPVSSFLSGGLDSSLISVLAKERLQKLNTYTIGTSEEDKKIEKMPDDQKYAKRLAEDFGFNHNEIIVDSSIIDLLPQMVYTLDEPIGDPAAINTYLISKMAADKGEKVVLSGMGADEIFFGYRRHRATLLALKYNKTPRFLKNIIKRTVNLFPVKNGKGGLKLIRWAKRFLSFTDLPEHETYMRSYSYYSKAELGQLFREDYSNEIELLYEKHKVIFNAKYKDDIINKICNTDIQMFMLGLNLTYTDRASMAASVEVRVPFIDRNFIKTVMAIPGKTKFQNNVPKYLLKKAAEKYLPEYITNRKKASFGAPIRSWISNDLKEMVDDYLSEEQINKRGIFNYSFVKNMMVKDREGSADYAYQIYMLLTIEIWFREFVD
jgi:asparagine synthase (glutamine-hydrolysing)